jgi:hypothetical protein
MQRQRYLILDRRGFLIRVAQYGRQGFGFLGIKRHTNRCGRDRAQFSRMRLGLGSRRKRHTALRWGRSRAIGIFKCIVWLHQTCRRPGRQRLGDPPQLTGNDPETKQNQTADNGGRAGTDERISEAEFVDRNTKSDHHQACKQGKRTDAIQYSRHVPSILSATP